MTFISYSQNSEDVLLWRALGHVQQGFYIDVGANDPEEHSVTKAFYDAGWRGISIEPLPAFHQAFLDQRPRDVNLAIAAGSADGELLLYDTPQVRGWASPEQSVAEMHRAQGHAVEEITVPVRTLASVCEEHVRPGQDIHFLKIDVEGFEGEVLRGMDFARWRPWVLVIEATLPGSRETKHETWEHLVTGQRYRYAWFDGLNRYYVAEEHAALMAHFGIQPNVFDDFISHHLDKAWNTGKALDKALQASQDSARKLTAWQRELEAQLEERDTRLRASDTRLRASDTRLREAGAELELLDARLRTSNEQAGALAAQLQEAQQQAIEERERAEDAIALLQDKLAGALETNRQVSDWARSLEERLVATLASTSWKLTQPVRKAGAIAQALRRPKLARRIVNRLTANERLRRLVIPVLRRHPALGERVSSSIAAVKLDPPKQAPAGIEVPEELRGLPVSVRNVLADLQRARTNQAGQ